MNVPTVGGLPRVDSRLRWHPQEDLFVLGANAVLELGPGGGNLMGAMRGARVVSNELRDLMWKHPAGHMKLKALPARSIFMNMHAALGDQQRFSKRFGDGSEGETELDVLAQQLNLSPQAETALRKARKDRKATRGLKGERDPLGAVHITARERRARYW